MGHEVFGDTAIELSAAEAESLRELVYRAHYNISMTPEKRAASAVEGVSADLRSLADLLAGHAQSDEQRSVAVEQFIRYRAGYLVKYRAVMAARSRTMSSMVTGPANFPVEQNRKRMDTEHRRLGEYLEWAEKAKAASIRAVREAAPAAAKADEAWQALLRNITRDLEAVAEIDAGKSPFSRSAFTNSLAGKLTRLSANGQHDLVLRALDHVQQARGIGKPFFAARNSVWALRDVAAKAAEKTAGPDAAEDQIIGEADGIRIVNNRQEERVQIFFPGKPDEATRARLKAGAWNWSPRNGAWQRKNTFNAICAARGFLPLIASQAA